MADEGEFDEEGIKHMIEDLVDNHLETVKGPVNTMDFKQFSRDILDEVFKGLLKNKKNFKYSVTVFLQQKNGAALSYGNALYVDNQADGQSNFVYEHPYFDLMVCVVGYKITDNNKS